MSIFRRPHGYLYLRCLKERRQTHHPYDYIRCGETSEKVVCSIEWVWVGAGAVFDVRSHGEVWESKGEWIGTRSVFSWFSCNKQKDHQDGFFFNMGCTGREASCYRGKLSAERLRARS